MPVVQTAEPKSLTSGTQTKITAAAETLVVKEESTTSQIDHGFLMRPGM